MKKLLLIAIAALALSGCALMGGDISSAGPINTWNPVSRDPPPLIAKDLLSAADNLDQAVVIGALSADDPAPKCLHSILQRSGLELPPGATNRSFTPKNDGVASAGAIAYIVAQQLKNVKSAPVDTNCEALLGRVVLDGVNSAKQAVPLVGILR